MKYKNFIVTVDESRFRLPKGSLVLDLYETGASIYDGTIIGTKVFNIDGDLAKGEPTEKVGNYRFKNIPYNRKYDIIISGYGITTQIPEEFKELDLGLPVNVTGTDLPYKENTNISIASAIDGLDSTSQIPRIQVLEITVEDLQVQIDDVNSDTTNLTNQINLVKTDTTGLYNTDARIENYLHSFTDANKVIISSSDGTIGTSSITKVELEYLDDATSNIQSQINLFVNYNTGKSIETVYRNGGKKSFSLIQDALNEAYSFGGNVIVHEKSTDYNEVLIAKNNVNIHLEGNAIINNTTSNPTILFDAVTSTITGEGSIKNTHSVAANRKEAVKIINGSNITLKNKYIYSQGSNIFTAGTTIYVSSSYVNIFSDFIQNETSYALLMDTGSSGIIDVKNKIISQDVSVYLNTNGEIIIQNTSIQGAVKVNCSSGVKYFKDSVIDTSLLGLGSYNLFIENTSNETIIFSGMELVGGSGTFATIGSDTPQIINIRKPSWGEWNVQETITMKGDWSFIYE